MLLSMDADRALVAEKDAEILALEAQIFALRAAKELAQSRLDSYTYPVLTLPPEIVSEVFLHFLPPYPDPPSFTGLHSPICLTHVCTQWRKIALSTPRLWRAIALGDHSWPAPEGGTALAELWLERSGDLPLSIHVADYQDYSNGLPSTIFSPLLPHRDRWERLILTICETTNILAIDGPMPLLHTLHILLAEQGLSNPLSIHDVPCLRTLVLDDFGTPSVNLPWSQLTSLTLQSIDVDECISILQQIPNLVDSRLRIWVEGTTQGPYPDIPLLCLEALVIEEYSDSDLQFFHSLVTPALRHLEFSEAFSRAVDSECIESLKAFISKSGCTLDELRVTRAVIPYHFYRSAFPKIPSIVLEE
ncbi:F-box domain-containing protein [Favolaschia claudopus]|uniref:F-box domain-containing protein n=1 Tax=Favolaschia claudopus TaxID=2862362 RepID=A0AAV9ZD74_9AGAR